MLRHRTERQGQPGAEECHPLGEIGLGKEIQLAGFGRMIDHNIDTAGHPGKDVADVEHTAHDHDHLDKVENRHRQHAAERGVGHHDERTENHTDMLRHRAVRDHVEHQAKRLDLRGNPAQI